MTADLFATKFDAHVDAVDAAFVRAIEAARAAAPPAERMQYMHLTMMRQLEGVNAEAVARAGLTEDEFQVRRRVAGVAGPLRCRRWRGCSAGVWYGFGLGLFSTPLEFVTGAAAAALCPAGRGGCRGRSMRSRVCCARRGGS